MTDRSIHHTLIDEAAEFEAKGGATAGSLYRARRQAPDPAQVYSVRIPASRLDELRRVAASHGMAPSALLRAWTIERLDAEIAGDPAERPTESHPRDDSQLRDTVREVVREELAAHR